MGLAVSLWPGGAGEAIPASGLELCAALLLGGWLPNMAVAMGWNWTSGDLLLATGAASGCGCGIAGTLPLPWPAFVVATGCALLGFGDGAKV